MPASAIRIMRCAITCGVAKASSVDFLAKPAVPPGRRLEAMGIVPAGNWRTAMVSNRARLGSFKCIPAGLFPTRGRAESAAAGQGPGRAVGIHSPRRQKNAADGAAIAR
ncbi:hypothetical protein GCM10023144_25680 [Pigmentiphaga soli]|uniref:Uncharacterized protein n=1 Tax=Pigmentiphaga soli TaxID=1007095 RepID=A0ABP8H3U2_9BURK